MRARMALWAAPFFGLIECGPITPLPVSITPFNTCAGCNGPGVTCDSNENACLSTSPPPLNYILVINIPESAPLAPGEAVTLAQSQVDCATHGNHCPAQKVGQVLSCGTTPSACVQVPNPSPVSGTYMNGLEAIFAQTSYIPTWPLSPPACEPEGCEGLPSIEASLLNLPLSTVFASGVSDEWAAFLPSPSAGYIQVTEPTDSNQPPFLQILPPLEPPIDGTVVFPESPLESIYLEISLPQAVKGWTAFVRDRSTHRVVSSRPQVVENGNTELQWVKAGILSGGLQKPEQNGYDIVLSPPPNAVGMAEFADPYLGLGQQPTQPQVETYPQVPKPVTVRGTVRSPAGTGVSASLHFTSTALYNYNSSCVIVDPDIANLLHYDRVISTDADGQYTAVLPQGTYTITMDPDAASGFAKTQANPSGSGKSMAVTLPTSNPCTTTQDTYDFRVEPLVDVVGTVDIADGRHLANATVVFAPSVVLLTPPAARPTLAQVDWPRPFQVVTGDDGSFRASVDPGAYDITVRPVDGTRLPWIVSPANLATGGQVFSASTKTPTPIQLPRFWIPAPSALDVTLRDQLGNPVTEALVRAYLFTSCTIPMGDTSCNGFALQIGQAFTDGNGSFEMFLTPVPFTPLVK